MPPRKQASTSTGLWMWIIFVQAIPCIGFLMTIVWAFWGGEERKSYFKAHLIWLCIVFALWAGVTSLGMQPTIREQIRAALGSDDVKAAHRAHLRSE